MNHHSNTQDAARPRPRRFPILQLCLIAAVWSVIIYYMVAVVDTLPTLGSMRVVFDEGRALHSLWILPALMIATCLRAERWRWLVTSLCDLRFRDALAVYGWSMFVSTFTPMRAGELVRPAWVRRRGGSFAVASLLLVSERAFDLLTVLTLLAVALIASPATPVWAVALCLGAVAGVVAILAGPTALAKRLAAWSDRRAAAGADPASDGRMAGLLAKVVDILRGFGAVHRSPRFNLRLLGMTAVIWMAVAAGYSGFFLLAYPDLHWSAGLAVVTAVNLTAVVWLSPGNLGPFESAAAVVLDLYGMPPEIGFFVAAGLHAVVLAATVLIGLASRLFAARTGSRFWEVV